MWNSWPAISLKEVTDDVERSKYFLFLSRHDNSDDYLKFSVLNGENSYQVEVTFEDIKTMSSKCRLPLEEFTNLTVSALTSENLATDTFMYSMSKTDSGLQLTWKKLVSEENLKIKLGSLNLKTVNSVNEICNTLQQLSKYLWEKNQEIKELRDEKETLKITNKHLKEIIDNEIVSKDELEKEIYSKFVLVLNKKKEKCKHYKEELSKKKKTAVQETSDSSDNEETQETPKKKNTSLLFEDLSDDSMPTLTQRVVRPRNLKRPSPRAQQEKHSTRTRPSSSKPPVNLPEEDTQELMDDL